MKSRKRKENIQPEKGRNTFNYFFCMRRGWPANQRIGFEKKKLYKYANLVNFEVYLKVPVALDKMVKV